MLTQEDIDHFLEDEGQHLSEWSSPDSEEWLTHRGLSKDVLNSLAASSADQCVRLILETVMSGKKDISDATWAAVEAVARANFIMGWVVGRSLD